LYQEKTRIEGKLELPESVGPDFPKTVTLFLPFDRWGNNPDRYETPIQAEIDWRSAKFEFEFHSIGNNIGFVRLQNLYYPIMLHSDDHYEMNWTVNDSTQALSLKANQRHHYGTRAQEFLTNRYPNGLSENAYLNLVNAFNGDLANRPDTLIAWSRAIANFYEEKHSDPEEFLTYINQIGHFSHKDLFEEAYDNYTHRKPSNVRHNWGEMEAILTILLFLAMFIFGVAVVLKIVGVSFITPQRFDFVEIGLISMITINILFHGMVYSWYRVIELDPFSVWVLCIAVFVVFYFNQKLLVPGLLLKKRWFVYLLAVTGLSLGMFLLAASTYLTPLNDYRLFFFEETGSWHLIDSHPEFRNGMREDGILALHLFLLFVAPIYGLGRYWIFKGMPKLKIQKEALNAELNNLKTQISPHFFFNSLNTVYGFALGEESPKTAEAITKMSNLMRFAIYHGDKDFIPLETELDYLEDYIELQRLRLNPMRHKLTFEVEGEPGNQQIAPLLLITLVENAFKHGISMSHDSYIYIDLFIQKNGLILTVENSVHPSQKELVTANGKTEGGIGLTNTKQRLELLYPGKYEWQIEESAEHYMARLSLDF
ncbi:MAG: sensor histidine kinase, partial [Bacteroidetes bacterium]|nr:sensor histidine kinase [Bacteroidota bacterium]